MEILLVEETPRACKENLPVHLGAATRSVTAKEVDWMARTQLCVFIYIQNMWDKYLGQTSLRSVGVAQTFLYGEKRDLDEVCSSVTSEYLSLE